MSETILRVNNLRKDFTNRQRRKKGQDNMVHAVNNVSFEMQRGRTLGLVGESGCGKSTAAKMVMGLIPVDGGSIYYEDICLVDTEQHRKIKNKEMEQLRKRMQIVFQDPSSCLDPRKNIEQLISEGIRKHKICPKNEMRDYCIEMMDSCGLEPSLLMRYPHELSGGQKQRVAIARSFALKPDFVVCDEITAALDVSVQSQILNLLLDLKEKTNVTYLFISHNLEVVKYFCDDIIIMKQGEIVERGKCLEVYENPKEAYTKLLLESIPGQMIEQNKWN